MSRLVPEVVFDTLTQQQVGCFQFMALHKPFMMFGVISEHRTLRLNNRDRVLSALADAKTTTQRQISSDIQYEW